MFYLESPRFTLNRRLAPEETGNSAVLRRDSAGIAVVESTVPAWGEREGWVVEDAPILDLAEVADDPSHEFFNVTDAARLSDGSFVVADDGSSANGQASTARRARSCAQVPTGG